MEVNLAVKSMVMSSEDQEECVTPRDPGSRIPPLTECPPAPRKNFNVRRRKRTSESPPNKKEKIRLEDVAVELIFALSSPKENESKEETDQRESFFVVSDPDFS